MTTFTFSKTIFTQNPMTEAVTSVDPVTLEIVSPRDVTGFTYALLGSNSPTSLDSIVINAPVHYVTKLADGTILDLTLWAKFGMINWTDGGVAKSTAVLSLTDTANNQQYSFAIGGDPLPAFTDIASAETWRSSITGYSAGTGAYAPGVEIGYATIPDSAVNEDDYIYGTAGDDTGAAFDESPDLPLAGGSGDDHIFGLAGNDTLTGGTGNDVLDGGGGVDYLYGGDGDDTLIFGIGDDRLNGGAGADVFKYYHAEDTPLSTYTRIRDFTNGEDVLDTSYYLAADVDQILATVEQTAFGVKLHIPYDVLPTDISIILLEDFVLADLDASDFVILG